MAVSGPKCSSPAAAMTASSLPDCSNTREMLASSVMSIRISPLLRPARMISCFCPSAAAIALPIAPAAPTNRILMVLSPRQNGRRACRLGHTFDFVTLKNNGEVFGHLLMGTTSFSGGELKRSRVGPLLGHVEQQLFLEVRKGPALPPIHRSRPLS